MVNVLWGFLPIMGLSLLTFTATDSSVSVVDSLSSIGCRDQVVSTDHQREMNSDVFEPREDNEGQPQETVG